MALLRDRHKDHMTVISVTIVMDQINQPHTSSFISCTGQIVRFDLNRNKVSQVSDVILSLHNLGFTPLIFLCKNSTIVGGG